MYICMTVKKTNEVIQLEYGNNVLIVSGDINDMNWGD